MGEARVSITPQSIGRIGEKRSIDCKVSSYQSSLFFNNNWLIELACEMYLDGQNWSILIMSQLSNTLMVRRILISWRYFSQLQLWFLGVADWRVAVLPHTSVSSLAWYNCCPKIQPCFDIFVPTAVLGSWLSWHVAREIVLTAWKIISQNIKICAKYVLHSSYSW